ncbi:MAG: TonB-dependent receptor [Flavobacteriaceae bacterium]|nr:TonB-dependent receptor [Flavobacteriaceae bacterium]|tara:strand:- start:56038 stop:58473 length:2436 start_codon:yes stop_codon:yes gene_type:complete
MRSKGFKIFIFFFFLNYITALSQNIIKGKIISSDKDFQNDIVEIYDNKNGFVKTVKMGEVFEIIIDYKSDITLAFVAENYPIIEKKIETIEEKLLIISLPARLEKLSEVVIGAKKKRLFQLRRLKDYEGTSVFAGKKTEVIILDQSLANLATNNARQIYSQIPGLNIYQNDDAGIQLNIGGRGLDPSRTSNFNTRQNGYDISADVLGYPESYYSPPAEAIDEIQLLRGAASLQYGTQFGGLVNFILKSANKNKPFELITRNTYGSFNLYTNYTSVSLSQNKLKSFGFANYKKGDGFRENSEFSSLNLFLKNEYEINPKSIISAEITLLKYLAKQAGGLTDQMFQENPFQSNRSRNWFEVDWLLYNVLYKHEFSKKSTLSASFFGLNAKRNALGFRTNRVSQIDPFEERDLIKGEFNNFGFEVRILNNSKIFNKRLTWVVGSKFYKSNNTSEQGPGSKDSDANFDLQTQNFPNYNFQSTYKYPNENLAFFGENIFYINDKLSITPGLRYEFIKTESDGFYKKTNQDGAGNVIFDQTIYSNEIRKRNFILAGLGASYKVKNDIEFYFNISENYRSVTFNDISIFNPAYMINPNITDETGSTTDFGLRGIYKNFLSYDLSAFVLSYNNRIGFVQRVTSDGNVKSERGNVGDARIIGFETLIDFNFRKFFKQKFSNTSLNYFVNFSFIESEYIRSQELGVTGKKVEFIPDINFKTGAKFGYKNFFLSAQYSFLSDQFTDSSNAVQSNLSGVIGIIPAYEVLDISASFSFKRFKFETGSNNALNQYFFTRRATGYPGPGIIPASPKTLYFTIQYKL